MSKPSEVVELPWKRVAEPHLDRKAYGRSRGSEGGLGEDMKGAQLISRTTCCSKTKSRPMSGKRCVAEFWRHG